MRPPIMVRMYYHIKHTRAVAGIIFIDNTLECMSKQRKMWWVPMRWRRLSQPKAIMNSGLVALTLCANFCHLVIS
jgi:hypothetical protein